MLKIRTLFDTIKEFFCSCEKAVCSGRISDLYKTDADVYGTEQSGRKVSPGIRDGAIPDQVYRKNLAELTESLSLTEFLRTPARQLSLGQRMRCEIAASLLHSPGILFLDEPTIGLDAVSKLAVRDFILKQNKTHGTTVILTTHDMQDIEALASRIILIGKGRILMDGSLSDIKKGNADIDETVAELYRSYDI